MIVQGLQKFTLLDYPGKLACTIFTAPCNLRCPFCHNSSLLTVSGEGIEWQEILDFLRTRRGILDGVCLTGGEPTLHKNLPEYLAQIKELGFLIKLDTNGTNPAVIQDLVQKTLVDYVALDVKNSPTEYAKTVGVANFNLSDVEESIRFLLSDQVAYEFRTTVVREFHTTTSLLELAAWIKGARNYYLQSFENGEQVLQPGLSSYSKEEMLAFKTQLKPILPVVELRGV